MSHRLTTYPADLIATPLADARLVVSATPGGAELAAFDVSDAEPVPGAQPVPTVVASAAAPTAGATAGASVREKAWLVVRPAQRVAGAQAKSSDKQSRRISRPLKPAPTGATSGDEFLPRDYFFSQATIATMIPITLKIDIIPAAPQVCCE